MGAEMGEMVSGSRVCLSPGAGGFSRAVRLEARDKPMLASEIAALPVHVLLSCLPSGQASAPCVTLTTHCLSAVPDGVQRCVS